MFKFSTTSSTKVSVQFAGYRNLSLLSATLCVAGETFDLPDVSACVVFDFPSLPSGSAGGTAAGFLSVKDSDGNEQVRQFLDIEVCDTEVPCQEMHCAVPNVINLPKDSMAEAMAKIEGEISDILTGKMKVESFLFVDEDQQEYVVSAKTVDGYGVLDVVKKEPTLGSADASVRESVRNPSLLKRAARAIKAAVSGSGK